jgi:hypothetical protein
MAMFDLKHADVVIQDGSSPPKQLSIHVGEGTLSFTEKRPIQYVKDRGLLYGVREGDQEPMDVKLDIIWEFLRATAGSGVPTPEDVLKQRGEAAGWVSSDPDPCNPYCVDIYVYYDPVCPSEENENIGLVEFRYEQIEANAKSGMLMVSGKCNVTQPLDSRVPQTT